MIQQYITVKDISETLDADLIREAAEIAEMERKFQEAKAARQNRLDDIAFVIERGSLICYKAPQVEGGKLHFYGGCFECDYEGLFLKECREVVHRVMGWLGLSGIVIHVMADYHPDQGETVWGDDERASNMDPCSRIPRPIPGVVDIAFDYEPPPYVPPAPGW